MSNISISLLLVYLAVSFTVVAFVLHSKMAMFMKLMWIGFVLMLPFLGAFTWLLIQSFDHKFQMDGAHRQNLSS